jgi:single-strand DNA-binding protein
MEHEPRNEVLLVGRRAAEPEERALPSGDLLATFRIVVDRPPAARSTGPRAATVDTLDCVARGAALRRAAQAWRSGDVLEVHGALRRRFFRTAGGATGSRYEVEVGRGKRLTRAA